MSKYDFAIDLSVNSSTGLILRKLRPDSVVLEFGCAAGRMTRYMKEEMGCQVYIVEYDRDAFQNAVQYAQDGICDDIMNYRWVEQFSGISFDAVIFADVLEHLTQPEEVLRKAAELLKDDGCIYVSVPNVTHNDILLKMYEERFDYTQLGLLDDTHIHFWGLENIKQLGKAAGLWVNSVEGTLCSLGDTEQNVQLGKNRLLENILQERQAGEVYQFVVSLSKEESGESVCTIHPSGKVSHIYLDTGRDFNADECIAVKAHYTGAGSYCIHFVIADVNNLQRVRLDPVENQGVILRSLSITQNGEEKNFVTPNGVQIVDGLYVPRTDPMVIAQVEPDQGPVTVDAKFLIPGVEYLQVLEASVLTNKAMLENTVNRYNEEIHNLQIVNMGMNADNVRLNAENVRLNAENVRLNAENVRLNRENDDQKRTILQTTEENNQLRTDLCAYIILANRKEKETLLLECSVLEKEHKISDLLQVISEKEQVISEKDRELYYFRNLRIIRLRTLAVRVLRKIKRCVKKLLGRTGG